MFKKNYNKGNIEVDNRNFEIEFWDEQCGSVDLPFFEVSEIIIENKKPWYSNKVKTCKRKIRVSYGWTENNRLELAKQKIKRYLQREKDEAEEKKQIEEFCNISR